jgi:hypothetical protein
MNPGGSTTRFKPATMQVRILKHEARRLNDALPTCNDAALEVQRLSLGGATIEPRSSNDEPRRCNDDLRRGTAAIPNSNYAPPRASLGQNATLVGENSCLRRVDTRAGMR